MLRQPAADYHPVIVVVLPVDLGVCRQIRQHAAISRIDDDLGVGKVGAERFFHRLGQRVEAVVNEVAAGQVAFGRPRTRMREKMPQACESLFGETPIGRDLAAIDR